jgi:hypothetical protein
MVSKCLCCGSVTRHLHNTCSLSTHSRHPWQQFEGLLGRFFDRAETHLRGGIPLVSRTDKSKWRYIPPSKVPRGIPSGWLQNFVIVDFVYF